MPDADASSTTIEGPAPYSPEISASETMQAQHSLSNDAPTDVNNNAVLARFQAQTVGLSGAEFSAAAARRTIIADKALG